MECTCIRYTELPHTSRLFTDLLYQPERVHSFYRHLASDPDAYAAAAAEIQFPAARRAELIAALREQNGDCPSLERLARPETVAVVTGQQVGLFSGPAYTVYKALTAVRLADELSARGIPAVPLFWLATEDHDFAEVNHAWLFDAEHHPVKLEMRRGASSQPVGGLALEDPPLDELRRVLAGFPYGEEVAAVAARCYTPGRTMGEAFGGLLRELLGKYGLLHLDPMAPAMRRLAAPLLRDALERAPELSDAVLRRNRELTEAGYHAQVHVEPQTSFVFLLENGRRLALRRQDRDYLLNGRRFTTAELQARAHELSPNALLRPVVQDSMLPTVAYIGGPAELAYLAQAEVIYRQTIGRMPVPVHRSGFTLLDARSRKVMARYRLGLADCFEGQEALKDRIATRLVPPGLGQVLEESRAGVWQASQRLGEALAGFDPTLAAALERSRRKVEYQFTKMERKIGREALRRDERAARDASWLYGLVYPDKHLQERVYSILSFLARHGLDLVDTLHAAVNLGCPDHQLLAL